MLTLLTTYFRAQKCWRYGSIAAVLCLVIVGITAAPRGADAIALALGVGAAVGGALFASFMKDKMLDGVAWIVSVIIDALQGLFINVVYLIVDVSRYTAFIDSVPVTRGWEIVRDVMNMFFVIVLLAIAVGTILQQEKYHYSKTLPKFIIAAILINFSKTIAGIFIDFANVVMLTFTGAIESTAGGNFLAMVGLVEFQQYVGAPGTSAAGVWEVLLSLIVLLAFVVIALIVVVVMLFILIFRIVALWFLVVLSPAAFFLAALPDDKGYAKKWWDQFINYLIVGPIMLFFLWLSFTTLAASSQANNRPQLGSHISSVSASTTSPIPNKLGTAIGTPQTTLGFFLGIVMLLGSMAVAQQLGVEGGKMAGSVVQGAKDYVAGKKGPSPMRWARDRWSAYSKQREHARQERAKSDVGFAMRAAAVPIKGLGEAYDAGMKALMATGPGIAVKDFWSKVPVIGTEARARAAKEREEATLTASEKRSEAGAKKQEAANRRTAMLAAEGGKEKLGKEKESLEAMIAMLMDKLEATEDPKERIEIQDHIASLEKQKKEVETSINAYDGKEAMEKEKAFLDKEAAALRSMLPPEGMSTDEWNKAREAKAKDIEEQAAFEHVSEPDRARLLEEAEQERGRKLDDKKRQQIAREAEEMEDQSAKLGKYIQAEETDGKGGAIKAKIADLRAEAIKLETDADGLEIQAKGQDFTSVMKGLQLAAPEFAKGFAQAAAVGMFGPAGLLALAPDMLNSSRDFGNRLTLEGQEIQMEGIHASTKKFGSLRDEIIKAIANGTAKGFSRLEQMGAKQEMVKRNLYSPDEIEGARREFVEMGAAGAALESFDYDTYKQYPDKAYGMTTDKLADLFKRGRIDVSKLKPESINADLLKAINRLPSAISAQLEMSMKRDPQLEKAVQTHADREVRRMKATGEDTTEEDKNTLMHLIKTNGMTRGFPNQNLGIGDNGNFTGNADEIKKNKEIILKAMDDDDVAPYILTGMKNKVFENPNSDLAKLLGDKFTDPNNDMALHVIAAIRRAAKNGDRAAANVSRFSSMLMRQIEDRYAAERGIGGNYRDDEASFKKIQEVLRSTHEIYGILHWGKTRIS